MAILTPNSYVLQINNLTPDALHMKRLAEYMLPMAELLGCEKSVYFQSVEPGSARLVARVAHEDIPKVNDRLTALSTGDGAQGAIKAQEKIDQNLEKDNTDGHVYSTDSPETKIIYLPGAKKARIETFGPIKQKSNIDGILTSISGADKTVHIQLLNGDIKHTNITTDRETAKKLAKYMYEPVRLFGIARWFRDQNEKWDFKDFKIEDFAVLNETDIMTSIHDLRTLKGHDWGTMPDPISTVLALRDRDGDAH